MDVSHKAAATQEESDGHRERITASYRRAETAQQRSRGTKFYAEVRSAFAQEARTTFGACLEVHSASDINMWERTRITAIEDLPVVNGLYRYESGDTKTVLYVLVERARARILTE